MFSHRDLKPEDIPAICAFPRTPEELFYMAPAATFPLTAEQFERIISRREGSTVVTAENRIVAYANFIFCHIGEFCTIGNVIVHPDFRKMGAATYLIDRLTEKARSECRVRRIRVSCFNANTAGFILYSRLGFTPVDMEIRKDFQGRKTALIHLEKAG